MKDLTTKTLNMKRFLTIVFSSLFILSCTNIENNKNENVIKLQTELDSIKKIITENQNSSKTQIATFLTFQKENAEQAMNFYIKLFNNSKIINIKRWEKSAPGKEGTIMHATFSLDGKLFMCSDSPAIHDWGFTPAVSNFVECKDEQQLNELFSKLSENGKVMMPLNNYGFSTKFGFVEDQFGVSWQLNLK